MYKIIVTHLTFGDETFPAPPGLSELLEPAWVHPDEVEPDNILDLYDRRMEKVDGKWRTIYTKKIDKRK